MGSATNSKKHIKNKRAAKDRRNKNDRRTFGAATLAIIATFQRRLDGVRRTFQRRKNTKKPKVSE